MGPMLVFLSAFGVAALAGVAALLRSGVGLTWGLVVSSALNSGLLGLAVSLLWYMKLHDDVYFLVGLCVLAGLGGNVTLDFALALLRKGGLTIKLGEEQPDTRGDKS